MTDIKQRIDAANREAVGRMIDSLPVWVDIKAAKDVVPGLKPNLILHSGPPISWDRMCLPQRNAVCGAAVYEGLAKTTAEADKMVAAGDIEIGPCHEHRTVGSMCGVTSYTMPVFVVRNKTFGNEGYCLIYESPGREKLSFGAYSDNVRRNLKWVEEVAAPVLLAGLKQMGGEMNLRAIIARALTMGDECHSRNYASTATFAMEIAPHLAASSCGRKEMAAVLQFIKQSDQFFLHLTMAAGKAIADAAAGIECSSIVTAMARNGVEVGIRVSGLGDQWFTGPAGRIEGLMFSGFTAEDGQNDLGDSAITETNGLGAFAHAASPSLALVKSGHAADGLRFTEEMRAITTAENPNFGIPALDSRGTPTGIDIRKVIESGVLPVIDTGIADKQGRGQAGVGNARAPMEAFKKALRAFAERYSAGGSR